MHPPDKAIAFNPRLDRNDGLLTNSLAASQALPYSSAEELVRQFSERCHQRLNKDRILRFPAVGKLVMEDDGKLRFLPEDRENFLEDSYGLPTLKVQPLAFTAPKPVESRVPEEAIETGKALPYKMVPVGDKWPKRYWWWAAATVLICFGAWQIAVLNNKEIPMALAKIIQGEKTTEIEEGRAAFLHPLIPSLQRQMATFGPTTTLSAATPIAVLPFNPEESLDIKSSSDTAAIRNDWRIQANPTAIESLSHLNPNSLSPAVQPLSELAVAGNPSTVVRQKEVLNAPDPAEKTKVTESTAPDAATILSNIEGPVPSKGYYLIVGSFPNPKEAEKRLQRIGNPIGQRVVLKGDNGMYRAGLFVSERQEEMNSILNELRERYQQPDAWALRYRGAR